MPIRIWLDDCREMPNDLGYTYHCKTVDQVINILLGEEEIWLISFDHDLGENQKTGYDLAKWIEREVHLNTMKPPHWLIHSANPVGHKNIAAAMMAAHKFYNSKGK